MRVPADFVDVEQESDADDLSEATSAFEEVGPTSSEGEELDN